MAKYKVNRDAGWPIVHEGRSTYALGETFESADDLSAAVDSGYLIDVTEKRKTDDFTREVKVAFVKADPSIEH